MKDKHKKQDDKTDIENKSEDKNTNETGAELNLLDELQSKNEALEMELQQAKDRLLRKAAEFENYKRRTEVDQFNLIKYGGENFIRKILPVVDDFERTLQHIGPDLQNDPVKEGIKLIYDKLMKILSEQGVSKIEAVGKEFDVHYHEAIMQRKAENVKPHTVLDEIETGYQYNEKVIRHSKVIVSEDPGDSVNNNKEEKE